MSLRITPLNSAALTLCFYRHTLAEEHDFSARENYKMVLKSQLGASVLTVTIWRGREGKKRVVIETDRVRESLQYVPPEVISRAAV